MTDNIAVMQPYAFPYIGYMNLVNASDKFVFYDDVNFIKKGWINRNSILLFGSPYRFSIPLKGQSQNRLIKDIRVNELEKFTDDFLKKLSSSYKNSIFKSAVLDYVRQVLGDPRQSISELAINSVKLFFKYVGVEKKFLVSSQKFSHTQDLGRLERLISINNILGSTNYINAISGVKLYNSADFLSRGIDIKYVKPILLSYEHCNRRNNTFYSSLSIIDIMMNLSEGEIRNQLDSYELI